MRALIAALVATLTIGISASAAVAQPKPTIVLVHGAWADASGWSQEIEALQQRGYDVVAPANPLRGLPSDAAYLRSLLTTIDGPVVLVGHSYGGAVISNAATGLANVKALVYIAAFVPDEGETLEQLVSKNPGSQVGQDALLARPFPLPDGSQGIDLYLTRKAFRSAFAPDVPRRTADGMWATQRPLAANAFTDPSGPVAWKSLPSWYLVSTQDRTIPAATQRFMAQRAGARTTRVSASHIAMVSQPEATLKIILAAAR